VRNSLALRRIQRGRAAPRLQPGLPPVARRLARCLRRSRRGWKAVKYGSGTEGFRSARDYVTPFSLAVSATAVDLHDEAIRFAQLAYEIRPAASCFRQALARHHTAPRRSTLRPDPRRHGNEMTIAFSSATIPAGSCPNWMLHLPPLLQNNRSPSNVSRSTPWPPPQFPLSPITARNGLK
jgi:hypothetical protein